MKPDELSLREIINQLNDINTKLTVLLTLSNDAAREVGSGACSAPQLGPVPVYKITTVYNELTGQVLRQRTSLVGAVPEAPTPNPLMSTKAYQEMLDRCTEQLRLDREWRRW